MSDLRLEIKEDVDSEKVQAMYEKMQMIIVGESNCDILYACAVVIASVVKEIEIDAEGDVEVDIDSLMTAMGEAVRMSGGELHRKN